MLRKKKKKVISIEAWLKNHQITFSILIPTLISVIALFISLKANRIAESQAQKNEIPSWDYKLINDQENDMQQVQFVSLKPDFKIDNLEIITPFPSLNKINYITTNDIWTLSDFQAQLLDTFLISYKVESTLESDFIPIAGFNEDSLPVIVKVNYIYNNEKRSSITLYKLTFRVYENKKLRIKTISYIAALEKTPILNYHKLLSYLYKTEYVGSQHFSVSKELLENIKLKDSSIHKFIQWTILAEEEIKLTFNFNDTTGYPINSIEVTEPVVFYGESRKKAEFKYRDSILSSITLNKAAILNYSQRMDSFLKVNPTSDTSYYALLLKSNWKDKEVFAAWVLLLSEIRIDTWKLFYPLKAN